MEDTGKTIALIKALGGSGGALPPITAADDGKVLTANSGVWGAGVQEYWIPVTASGSELSIPDNKQQEVATAINNSKGYWVRGAVIGGTTYYPGYVSNNSDFIVPLSKSFMQDFGFDCAGKLHIVHGDPYTVSLEPDKFIVTLTPTALDYSGTMDKTVAEINAAYEAGQEIVFRIVVSVNDHVDTSLNACNVDTTNTYPSFDTYLIEPRANVLVRATTAHTNDGTKQTYSTKVYTLTPAT